METRLLTRGPSLFQSALITACIFTLKVLRSKYAPLVDEEEGRKAFNLSLSLVRRCSIEDNDLPGRFSKIFAQLWAATPENCTPNGMKVTSRLGGSLLHDALWKWREKYGGQPSSFPETRLTNTTSPDKPETTANFSNGSIEDPSLVAADTSAKDPPSTSPGHGQEEDTVVSRPPTGWLEESGAMDMDLIDEINNEWMWSGGLSSLLALDLDALIPPQDINGTGSGSGNNNDNVV